MCILCVFGFTSYVVLVTMGCAIKLLTTMMMHAADDDSHAVKFSRRSKILDEPSGPRPLNPPVLCDYCYTQCDSL